MLLLVFVAITVATIGHCCCGVMKVIAGVIVVVVLEKSAS